MADMLYDNGQDALASRATGFGVGGSSPGSFQGGKTKAIRYNGAVSPTLSFLRPTTPYGDTYTQSYTKYLNAPGSSYVHPLFPVFNDRRPAQKVTNTLGYNKPGTNPGSM